MSVQRFKVRDPRYLLSSPHSPNPAASTAPCNPPPAPAPASLATAVMANSVEGPAPQPSKQPAGAEAEAVAAAAAAAKEERRLSEPVSKKRRLLQATEAEQGPEGQDVPEDILAQVINAVGIDSNLAESEVEEPPPTQHAEEVAGLQYLKEVRSLPPGVPLPPRMRAPDPRVRIAYPPQYAPLEGHYAVREVRHPYPYALRPHELGAPPPPYRHFFPRPYLRGPLPPAQALTRLPVRPPGPEHLSPQHGAPSVPRHLRPPPLHPSPTGSPTEVRHVPAPPPHPGFPGPNPGNPTRVYPGGPMGRPELQTHLREVRVPFHALPGAPYPHVRARVPEGLTRLAYDPRDPGRELGPHQVVVAPHYSPGSPLPPRPVYSPDRHLGADPTWRPQPTEESALRPPRRIIDLPSPCVELIPIGPRRSSTASPPAAEGRQGSNTDNYPANTPGTGPKPVAEGPESRRQSAPVLSVEPVRPPLAQRSFSFDTPRDPPAPAAPAAEARRSSDPAVVNVSESAHVDGRGHVSGEEDATENDCEGDTRPSSTNSDVTIEKVVLVNPGSGVVLPRLVQHSEGRKAAPREEQPPSGDAGKVETRSEQSTVGSEAGEVQSQAVEPGCGGDRGRAPTANLNARRPASEPPSGSTPSQVTTQRPASLPAPGTAPRPCPEGDDNVTPEDAVFMERLQLVLSDLLSVPEATQLQELSCSPARLLSTLVRRCGVQPSANPDLKKRLREDFKTMVRLCMPPALIQDFGWESCTSEQILTQLLRLSHNGEDVNRRSSLSSYMPPDEVLEDDVFSPPTPHAPPHTPQPSHTHPQLLQPPQPSPQAPLSSQAHAQHFLPSQPPPLTSQPSHPSPQKFHPSHPLQQTSQPSPTHPQSSKASHPPPLTSQPSSTLPQTSQPSSTLPQTSQPSQTHPKHSQPSQPLPQTSEPSHPAPQTSQPSQTHSEPSQPSQTKPHPSLSSPTHPQTSQPSQTHSQPSQPSQTQPKTSQPSHSPASTSQPSQSHSQPSQPSQTHPEASHPPHPTPSASEPSPTHPKTSQPSQPPPVTSQSSVAHPETSKASHPTHPSPQSSPASQHPPASSSHSSKPSQNPPQVVKPSQPSPQRSQPTQPTSSSSQPPDQASRASPQVSKPSHPTPASPILSSIRQSAPRPSLLPLTSLEHQYIPSSPTYHPASPSYMYQHLPPSSHPSHPPPLNSQPVLHTSHPPLHFPAASTVSSSSHLPSHTSQASHVITSPRVSHLPPLTSTASHLPPQSSEPHLHKPSHSPSSTSHPHHPASPSQPQHPMSRSSHLPPSPSHTSRSSPLISPVSPPTSTYITLLPSSRASHLPSHASSPSSSSSPTHPPSPSHSYIPVSSPSHVQPPRAPQYLPHVSQGAHLPQLVHSTHIQPHPSMPPRYPEKMDEFEYPTQLQYYLQTAAPRPGFPPQHYALHRPPPMRLPVPYGRKEVPAPPVPGKDGVIRHNHHHQQHQQQPYPPPPRLVLRHSPPPPSHVRLTSEKWLGNDGVVRPPAYPSTNGQVSPTSKSLPT